MKWVKKDCYGNEEVLYSADVIERIKELCQNLFIPQCNCKVISYKSACRGCENNTARVICSDILKIIKSEDE